MGLNSSGVVPTNTKTYTLSVLITVHTHTNTHTVYWVGQVVKEAETKEEVQTRFGPKTKIGLTDPYTLDQQLNLHNLG